MERVLKLLRISGGYSIKELAEKLEITAGHLSRIESGEKNPSQDLLKKYGKIFHLRVSTIMFFDEEREGKGLGYQELMLLILETICKQRKKKMQNSEQQA